MIPGTRRFVVYRTILVIAVIIWVIVVVKTAQVNFKIALLPIVGAGALLLTMQFIVYRLARRESCDLEITELNKIDWASSFLFFSAAFLISMVIVLMVKLFNPAVMILREDPGSIVAQIIGGFISGMVGFMSAILMSNYQLRNERLNKIQEKTNNLWFEIIHNLLTIQRDMNDNVPYLRRLKTECWEPEIAAMVFLKGYVKGFLIELYSDLDFYNYMHQLQRGVLLNGEEQKTLRELIKQLKPSINLLAVKLNRGRAIVFGEMVSLGIKEENSWSYSDDWKKIYEDFLKENKRTSCIGK